MPCLNKICEYVSFWLQSDKTRIFYRRLTYICAHIKHNSRNTSRDTSIRKSYIRLGNKYSATKGNENTKFLHCH
jgi:hypothetical protein